MHTPVILSSTLTPKPPAQCLVNPIVPPTHDGSLRLSVAVGVSVNNRRIGQTSFYLQGGTGHLTGSSWTFGRPIQHSYSGCWFPMRSQQPWHQPLKWLLQERSTYLEAFIEEHYCFIEFLLRRINQYQREGRKMAYHIVDDAGKQ